MTYEELKIFELLLNKFEDCHVKCDPAWIPCCQDCADYSKCKAFKVMRQLVSDTHIN